MIRLRKAGERGHAEHGWLRSWHSFSFAGYVDPQFMGFSVLRVLNDDIIAPGQGFGMHAHRDMEIITYVLEGELEHTDSMGNGSIIRPGEVQRMSAGSGIRHSEFNPSHTQPVRLLQIWIEPDRHGGAPEYEQKAMPLAEARGRWCLLASPDGRDGSLSIHQDALMLASVLANGDALDYLAAPQRVLHLHLARGTAVLNDTPLEAGDAAFITGEQRFQVTAGDTAEILLFDLPPVGHS